MGNTATLPVASDDANRQQLAASVFYTVADYFAGSDTVQRMEPGNTGSRILGPSQSAQDVGVGQGGEIYIRGRSGQVGASQQPPTAGEQAAIGLPVLLRNPIVLLALAGLAIWLLRKA